MSDPKSPRLSVGDALRESARWIQSAVRGYERALASGLAIAGCALLVFMVLRRHESLLIRSLIQAEGVAIRSKLQLALDSHAATALRLARQWEGMPFDAAAFTREVDSIIATEPVFRGFEWRNADFEAVAAAPLTMRLPGADLDSTAHSDLEVAEAWVTDHPEGSASPTFMSARDRRLIAFAAPLMREGGSVGVITGVAHVRDLLDLVLSDQIVLGMRVAVREGFERIYGPDIAGDGRGSKRTMETVTVTSGALTWDVEYWPSPELMDRWRSFGPPAVLLAGLFAAVAVASALSSPRSREQLDRAG